MFWALVINTFHCRQIYWENNFIIIFWKFWGKDGFNLNAFLQNLIPFYNYGSWHKTKNKEKTHL
jgi:hypothetical protein